MVWFTFCWMGKRNDQPLKTENEKLLRQRMKKLLRQRPWFGLRFVGWEKETTNHLRQRMKKLLRQRMKKLLRQRPCLKSLKTYANTIRKQLTDLESHTATKTTNGLKMS